MESIFWSKVEKTNSCWLWKGSLDKDGYGKYGSRIFGRLYHTDRAHRLSYILLKGQISKEFQIDHLCKIRNCVNPDHLEPVSLNENVMRSSNYIAINTKKTHCIHGHEFTKNNTHITSNNHRVCIDCKEKYSNEKSYANHIKNMARWEKNQKDLENRYIKQLKRKIKTHCIHGHEFIFENTRYSFEKNREIITRQCRTCDRESSRKRRNININDFREYRIFSHGVGGP